MLEELERTVLVGEAADLVVGPEDGHVPRTDPICRAHHAPGEVGALDGRLEDELLARPERDPLANEEVGVEVELIGEALGRDAALLVGHRYDCHPGSFRQARTGASGSKKGPGGAPRILERATGLEPASVSLGS